jgi:hypothetical protein
MAAGASKGGRQPLQRPEVALKSDWDLQIYAKGKSLRMPYCAKEGEQRFLQRAHIDNFGVKVYKETDACKHFCESYDDWLLTSDEPALANVAPAPVKPERAESDQDDDEEDEQNWKGWTLEKAREVIERLHDKRAATHKERVRHLLHRPPCENSS